jgi:hypothetical protein
MSFGNAASVSRGPASRFRAPETASVSLATFIENTGSNVTPHEGARRYRHVVDCLRTIASCWYTLKALDINQSELWRMVHANAPHPCTRINNMVSQWLRGQAVLSPRSASALMACHPPTREVWECVLWDALKLQQPIGQRFPALISRLPKEACEVVRQYLDRRWPEPEMLQHLLGVPALDGLGCLVLLGRYASEVVCNDSASDIALLIARHLVVIGSDLVDLGVAEPLAGYVDDVVFPTMATRSGIRLSWADIKFLDACALLERMLSLAGLDPRLQVNRLEATRNSHANDQSLWTAVGPLAVQGPGASSATNDVDAWLFRLRAEAQSAFVLPKPSDKT